MGLLRIPLQSDTTITTFSLDPTLRGLGNAGASPIVDVWAWYNYQINQKFLARTLAKLNLTALTNAVATNVIPNPINDSTVSCNLKFFNVNHAETQANGFTLQAFPMTRDWSEGSGLRIDTW